MVKKVRYGQIEKYFKLNGKLLHSILNKGLDKVAFKLQTNKQTIITENS